MATLGARLKHAWNAFTSRGSLDELSGGSSFGGAYSGRPDRNRPFFSNERSIISAVYTRLAIDVSAVDLRHVRVDDDQRYLEDIKSDLNECLTLAANLDQPARMFRRDIAMSLFDQGCIAVVPIDTTLNPAVGSFDIQSMRVGQIMSWQTDRIRVRCYNEQTGYKEDLTVLKKYTAIIENPLYEVMNEPNSTFQRLQRKLNLLDVVDEASSSGKLDMIVQLPYTIKTESKRQQAEQRRTDLEFQLKDSTYGVAYIDATEKITQLNRAVENQLLPQVEYLTKMLYEQLGLSPEVMAGAADEKTMLNYWDRTIEPIVEAIVEAMRPKFLSKTARTQKQQIMYFRNAFKLVPIGGEGGIADIADKFTRNEIASSNEIRQIVGWRPSKEPKADMLINANMPQGDTGVPIEGEETDLAGMVADLGLEEAA